jgi:replicative DNA helicase
MEAKIMTNLPAWMGEPEGPPLTDNGAFAPAPEMPLIAPHTPEAEEAVLGSILMNPEALHAVKAFLFTDDFFLEKNGIVYRAMLNLQDRHEAIDNLTVIQELRNTKLLESIGGAGYVTFLINHTPDSTNAETYARMVEHSAYRRRYIGFAEKAANLAWNGDMTTRDLAREINTTYQDVTARIRSRNIVSGKSILDKIWQSFEERLENPANVRGLSSGIQKLDRDLMGFRAGLYAIGGASSMGKSTLAGGLVRAFTTQAPGIYVPTEVTGERAVEKIATDVAGIPYKQYLSGFLNDTQVSDFTTAYSQLYQNHDNLTVVDTERPSIQEIEAEIIRTDAKWLLIDSGTAMAYQNMRKGTDLREAITLLCQQLQNISRMGITVIALWQTGRNAKDRQSKVPQIHDFKESGSIEETADVCLGLYRHDYYVARKMAEPTPQYPPGSATVFILKDRDGGDGEGQVTLGFRAGHGFTANIDPRLDGMDGR